MYYKPAMQLFFLIMIKMINEIHGCDLFMNIQLNVLKTPLMSYRWSLYVWYFSFKDSWSAEFN